MMSEGRGDSEEKAQVARGIHELRIRLIKIRQSTGVRRDILKIKYEMVIM